MHSEIFHFLFVSLLGCLLIREDLIVWCPAVTVQKWKNACILNVMEGHLFFFFFFFVQNWNTGNIYFSLGNSDYMYSKRCHLTAFTKNVKNSFAMFFLVGKRHAVECSRVPIFNPFQVFSFYPSLEWRSFALLVIEKEKNSSQTPL